MELYLPRRWEIDLNEVSINESTKFSKCAGLDATDEADSVGMVDYFGIAGMVGLGEAFPT